MKTLNIGINEFNLDEMDGNDLHRLAQGLISDLIYFSNNNIDDDLKLNGYMAEYFEIKELKTMVWQAERELNK